MSYGRRTLSPGAVRWRSAHGKGLLVVGCDVWQVATGPARTQASWAGRLAGLPALWTRGCRRLVVVAVHLDEDIAAAGGLMAAANQRGIPIEVVAITDDCGAAALDARNGFGSTSMASDAAERAVRTGHGSSDVPGTAMGDLRLQYRRAHRTMCYEKLGAGHVHRSYLRLAPGTVPGREDEVVAALSETLGAQPTDPAAATWIVAPWDHDGNGEHEATGRAAARVAVSIRASLLQYLVTAWTLADPSEVPWDRARTVPMSPRVQGHKVDAIPYVVRPAVLEPVADRELFLTR